MATHGALSPAPAAALFQPPVRGRSDAGDPNRFGSKFMKPEAVCESMFVNHAVQPTPAPEIFSRVDDSALYEVIKLVSGVPLFFEAHMERFRRSAVLSGRDFPVPDRQVLAEITELAARNGQDQINAKVVWSGTGGDAWFLTYFIRSEYPGTDAYARGVHAVLYDGERPDPNIKTLRGSFRERVGDLRTASGAYEALLVDRNGFLTEGSRSNLFFVREGRVWTPPAGAVLMGVTRAKVMEICRQMGAPAEERPLHRDELSRVDGMFITGTTVDVLPVASVGEMGMDSVGQPMVREILGRFEAKVRADIAAREREAVRHEV
jgi:branched-chain amino acid aminotransferase